MLTVAALTGRVLSWLCYASALTQDDVGACVVHKQQRLAVASALPVLQPLLQVVHRPRPVNEASSGYLKRRLQASSPFVPRMPTINAPCSLSCLSLMACLSWRPSMATGWR